MRPFVEIRNEWKNVCSADGIQLVLTSYVPGATVHAHSHRFSLVGMPFFGGMTEAIPDSNHWNCNAFDIGLQPFGKTHSNLIGSTGLRSFMVLFDKQFPARFGIEPSRLDDYRFFRNSQAVKIGVRLVALALSRRISQEDLFEISRSIFEAVMAERKLEVQKKPNWLIKIVQHIEQNLHAGDAPHDVGLLAELAGRHPDYVSRRFKEFFGETLSQFRLRRRVCKAARLFVNTEKSSVEISAECGFSDQPHMIRMFNNFFGMTPVTLREISTSRF